MLDPLQPSALWKNFSALNAVPRPSKKEEKVIAFIEAFGRDLGLQTEKDSVGNVLIRKPATPGMEDRQTVVLQSHLDMVCQKNAGTEHDFETEGIDMYVDGDWVKARGTTLGADNGLGVASIMSILASTDIEHPAIEAIFTIDEETGMTGAQELKQNWLKGKLLLNLDTEDDDELTIGCAGGIDVTGLASYRSEAVSAGGVARKLTVSGLSGGHSGMDIHKGLGNANKLMNRILHELTEGANLCIAAVEGGNLRNAIPRESQAHVVLNENNLAKAEAILKEQKEQLTKEYRTTDPNLRIEWETADMPAQVMNREDQKNVIRAIYAIHSGIYRMSPDIHDLVQTSNNLARVAVKEGKVEILCLTRSSVDAEKMDMANAIAAAMALCNAEVRFSGSYPGWTPDPTSKIVDIMRDLYIEMFDEQPKVNACHAGLECGLIGDRYPGMEMISFGPNIRGAHSPDEKAQISSVQKYWKFLLETLRRTPKA